MEKVHFSWSLVVIWNDTMDDEAWASEEGSHPSRTIPTGADPVELFANSL
jgi:hypothetical protein